MERTTESRITQAHLDWLIGYVNRLGLAVGFDHADELVRYTPSPPTIVLTSGVDNGVKSISGALEEAMHELFHWLVASESQRRKNDFGLSQAGEDRLDLDETLIQEAMCLQLGIEVLERAGIIHPVKDLVICDFLNKQKIEKAYGAIQSAIEVVDRRLTAKHWRAATKRPRSARLAKAHSAIVRALISQ